MGTPVSKDESRDPQLPTPNRVYTDVGRIKVTVIRGNIFKEQADVMIWGIDRSLDLTKGLSSQALLSAAGDKLQTEIKKMYPLGLTSGNIAMVNAGNLNCKEIYFISLEKWTGQDSQQKVLWNIIWDCLSTANKSKLTSIVTPAIGSGFLGYPAVVVAKNIFECIMDFSNKHPETTLKIVTIAIFGGDREIYEAYRSQARIIACPGSETLYTRESSRANFARSTNALGRFSRNQRNVLVKIHTGKLANWRADVLVCSCSSDLKLSNGGLAQSLLEKAGSQLQDECNLRYPHGIPNGQVAVANGYNLHCKKVYFGTLASWSGDGSTCKKELATFVFECLNLAHKYNMQSIAFPTLGTGKLEYPPPETASIIHACVEDFSSRKPQFTLLMHIVVYEGSSDCKTVRQVFEQELTNRTATQLLIAQHPSPQPHLPSPHARIQLPPKPIPQRKDTREYFKYMYQSDPRTPKSWEKFHHSKTIKELNVSGRDQSMEIFPVTGPVLSEITQLLSDTLQQEPSHTCKNINVKEVSRVENLQLFETYANFRQTMFQRVSKEGRLIPLEEIKACKKGQALTAKFAKHGSILYQDIYHEVNEHFLFHGTIEKALDGICLQNLDHRLSKAGRFGHGIYCAETPAKSNDYTDNSNEKKMFLVRACLGCIYIHNGSNYSFKRAPCKSCRFDGVCSCNCPLYDSVVAEGQEPYREFVLYDKDQVYPEYLITYTCR